MTDQADRMDAKQTRCSVCKHPVAITAGPGRRTRRSVDTGRSKTNRRRNRTADTGPAISTRLILPGRPDPKLAAARA